MSDRLAVPAGEPERAARLARHPPTARVAQPTPGADTAARLRVLQSTAGNRAVTALVRGLQPGVAIVQRSLDESLVRRTTANAGIDSEFRAQLIQRVRNYNTGDKPHDHSEPYLDKRMMLLDGLEHDLYAWFEDNKERLDDNPAAPSLFKLMNSIQAEHRKVVGARAAAGHGLWTTDELDAEERAEIDEVWADVVNFRGAFKIKAVVHTLSGNYLALGEALEPFKQEILANLARLMSRPRGRDLIKALHAGAADGGIDTDKGIEFVMTPIYKARDYGYVGLKAVDKAQTSQLGFAKGRPKPGTGSGAGVEIAPGVRDASLVDFDAEHRTIPSPAFIGLGHELIHAAHYQRGAYSPGGHDPVPDEYHGDLEEFLTIADPRDIAKQAKKKINRGKSKHKPTIGSIAGLHEGLPTEAELRAEHGLGIRHGHSSSANPIIHPGVQPQDDPSTYVKDPVEWLDKWFPASKPPRAPQPLVTQALAVPVVAAGGRASWPWSWLGW